MTSFVDRAQAVRAGEELDVAKVAAFLAELDPSLADGLPHVAQFPGGVSNLTYLLTYPSGRELVLRRPPFGHRAKSAHDMLREARVMQALRPVYPYVPRVIATCDDSALGAEFFVMERVRGIIPRTDLPQGVVLSPDDTRALCCSVLDRLIELHKVDYVAAGLSNLGKGEGYAARQISGWSDRYRKARTPNVGDFEDVMTWLAEKLPAHEAAITVVHNDYRFDNVVLDEHDPMRVIGVLDWEMATLGDPLMDLGNSLAYWVQASDDPLRQRTRRQPTHLPGMFTRAEVIAYYGEQTGIRIDNFDFYEVYGLFRLAVIAQQIYYRHHLGQTKNPEHAGYAAFTEYLGQQCRALIERSEL